MHTRIPADLLGEKLAERCSNIWWTAYVLDRTLSSAVGAPTSVHDEDIKAYLAPPQQSSQRNATLSLHVRLSRLISQILNGTWKLQRSSSRQKLTLECNKKNFIARTGVLKPRIFQKLGLFSEDWLRLPKSLRAPSISSSKAP